MLTEAQRKICDRAAEFVREMGAEERNAFLTKLNGYAVESPFLPNGEPRSKSAPRPIGDRTARDVRQWQSLGSPPPGGGKGAPCEVCGVSICVEVGGGDNTDVYRPNLDIRDIPGVDIVHDLEEGTLPWHTGHAMGIKCIHAMEHISHAAGQAFLREAHRVLRPGGSLYLMICDFDFILERLREEGLVWWWLTSVFHDEYVTAGGFHRWCYNWTTIKQELEDAGFVNVTNQGLMNAWDLKVAAVRP